MQPQNRENGYYLIPQFVVVCCEFQYSGSLVVILIAYDVEARAIPASVDSRQAEQRVG